MEHTKGPWAHDWYHVYPEVDDKQGIIADVYRQWPQDDPRDGEGAANCRLIAAAPELLEALQMVCDSGVQLAEPIESAMLAAIAKAKAVN